MSPDRRRQSSVLTALIYTRVSSDDQAREGVSLDTQIAECRQYIARQGWAMESEFQDVMSGKRNDRPGYQALLAEVRGLHATGRQIVVVVAALDRFGRRLLERIRCREELKTLGVPTHSVRDGGEVSDLVANILGSVAQEEVRRLGERVAAARRHIVNTGWAYPARTAFGYQLRDATPAERAQGSPMRVLEPDPLATGTVQELFNRAADGESIRGAARWLASMPEPVRGGRSWAYDCVRDLLSSPTYVARPAEGSPDVLARPVAHWLPIVDDETWARVRQRIASHQHMPRQANGKYLLTGVLRCTCGGRMVGASGARQRYRCTGWGAGARHPRPGCRRELPLVAVNAAVLATVDAVVSAAVSDPTMRVALDRAWRRLDQPGVPNQAARATALEQQVKTARRRLADGAGLLVDGTLDRVGYEALRDQQREILDAAEAELGRLRTIAIGPKLPALDVVLRELGGWAVALRTADIPAQRDVLSGLVDHITTERIGWGRYEVEITWTPLGDALQGCALALAA